MIISLQKLDFLKLLYYNKNNSSVVYTTNKEGK